MLLNSYLIAFRPWLGSRQANPAVALPSPGGTLLYQSIQALEALLRDCREALILWQQRSRQRRCLREMSPHLLRDIGLERGEALREARKPCWRG